MKTTFETRDANILLRAQSEGFDFDFSDSLENQISEAENFLLNNLDTDIWEFCEVSKSGLHQHVDWSDGKDLFFWSDGQITDWSRKVLYVDFKSFKLRPLLLESLTCTTILKKPN